MPVACPSLVRPDVGGVHFNAHGLADEINRQDESRVRALPGEPPDDPAKRTVHHLDHHPFMDHRAGIVGELAFDEQALAARQKPM